MSTNGEEKQENGVHYFVDEEGQYYFQPVPPAEKGKELISVPSGNDENTADTLLEDPIMVDKINTENCRSVTLVPSESSNRVLSYVLVMQEENKSQNIRLGIKVNDDKSDVYIFEERKMGDKASEEEPDQPPNRSTKKVRAKQVFTCNICAYTCDTRFLIVRHLTKHSNARPHKCVMCEGSFKTFDNLQVHIKKKHKVKKFKCQICSFKSTEYIHLEKHIFKHNDETLFSCDLCGKSFRYKESVYRHIYLLHNNTSGKLLECKQCGKSCPDKDSYNVHKQTHAGEKLKCQLCPYTTTKSGYLRRHRFVHTDEKPFFCDLCGKPFKYKQSLCHHINSYHNRPSGKLLKCKRCGKSCPDKDSYNVHKQTHTGEKFKCQLCPYTCKHSKYLKAHLLVHTDVKSFSCELCDKSFKNRKMLLHHHKSSHNHNNRSGKLLKCKRCGKSCPDKDSYNVHKQTHAGEKLKCQLCPYTTTKSGYLRRHRFVHTDEKPFFCDLCGKPFKYKQSLCHHINSYHNRPSGKLLKCKRCGKSCPDKYSYNVHKQTHAGEKLKCQLCPYTTTKSGYLRRHRFVHTDEKPFFCDLCGKPFKYKQSLCHHINSYHNRPSGKLLKCRRCGKSYPDKDSYNIHKQTHAGEKLKCQLCPYTTTTSGYLRKHLFVHTDEKSFFCDLCGKSFKNKQSLHYHINAYHNHNRPSGKLLKCRRCGKSYPDKDSYNIHKQTHVGEKFKCQLCPYITTISASLRKHLFVHTDEKLFSCDLCDISLKNKVSLRRHLNLHHNRNNTSDMPLQCNLCGKSCPDKYSYRVHRKTHPGEKFFKCEFCPYASIRFGNLKTHILQHTGEKPFSCNLCDKSYRQNILLKRHHESYHKHKIDLECKQCGKSFPDKNSYNVHNKIHTCKKSFKCQFCPYTTTTSHYLKTHLLQHTDEKSFSCNLCNQSFRKKKLLDHHHDLYHNPDYVPKLHSCHECNRTFKKKNNLIWHLAKHNPHHAVQRLQERELSLKGGKQKKGMESVSPAVEKHGDLVMVYNPQKGDKEEEKDDDDAGEEDIILPEVNNLLPVERRVKLEEVEAYFGFEKENEEEEKYEEAEEELFGNKVVLQLL